MLHAEDPDIFRYCIEHGYTILTQNRRHLKAEHEKCLARGEIHHGVLVTPHLHPDELYRWLRAYLGSTPPDAAFNQFVLLEPPEAQEPYSRSDPGFRDENKP